MNNNKDIFLPKYQPHTFQKNKIPPELFEAIRQIIYQDGYMCYHDDEGCHFVLDKIVGTLHRYRIEEAI